MKALFFQNPTPHKNSFLVQEDNVPYFYDKLHYHPELQLTVINDAEGTRFVGSNVASFKTGDVYLLGPNLPHVFRCADKYYRKNKKLRARGISVYFLPHSFGINFLDLPEAKGLKQLIDDSSKGIVFSGRTAVRISDMIIQLKKKHGFEKLCFFLEILRVLSESDDKERISGIGFSSPLGDVYNKRLHKVFDYLADHFHEEIKLSTLSNFAGMSPTALCRFFKQRTRKTIFRFLIEIRINHACKLLEQRETKMADAAWKCGYHNISNFNRQFLSVTGMTPRKYMEQKQKL